MSYEPQLIIRKDQLAKCEHFLELEQYGNDEQAAKVAKFLLDVNKHPAIKFDYLELVLCKPELTSFNDAVRNKLHELEIDFRTDW